MSLTITELFGLPSNASVNEIERRAYITGSDLYGLVARLDIYKVDPEKEQPFVTKDSAESVIKKYKDSWLAISQAYLDLVEFHGLPDQIKKAMPGVPNSNVGLQQIDIIEQAKIDQLPPAPPLSKEALPKGTTDKK